ncbi:MAG: hypothetical protein ACLU9S_22840 [Oscillospiraceae bacterium]
MNTTVVAPTCTEKRLHPPRVRSWREPAARQTKPPPWATITSPTTSNTAVVCVCDLHQRLAARTDHTQQLYHNRSGSHSVLHRTATPSTKCTCGLQLPGQHCWPSWGTTP